MIGFKTWLTMLRHTMYENYIIQHDTVLDVESYRPLYDDGLSPRGVMIEEYGNDYNMNRKYLPRLPRLK